MRKQFFVSELRCSFNLREPRGKDYTLIYMVSRIDGRQYKFPTGVKVNPTHWLAEHRRVRVEGCGLTVLDRENNRIANFRIEEMTARFERFKRLACANKELLPDFPARLRSYLKHGEAECRNITVVNEAFRHLYNPVVTTTGTLRTNRSRLRKITDYLSGIGACELNQQTINGFSGLLESQGVGVKRLNECCGLMKRLINKAVELGYDDVNPVSYSPVKDRRRGGYTKRGCLLPDETEALRRVSLRGEDDTYRRIFLLQTECGIRASDLPALLAAKPGANDRCVTIVTRKEGIKATVVLTQEMRLALAEFQAEGFGKLIGRETFTMAYNMALKRIAHKAGLNRMIIWHEQRGRLVTEMKAPLHEVISSHFARHTFITRRVREGWNAGVLRLVTGHADETMIRRVYTHLTEPDLQEMVMAERRRVAAANNGFKNGD